VFASRYFFSYLRANCGGFNSDGVDIPEIKITDTELDLRRVGNHRQINRFVFDDIGYAKIKFEQQVQEIRGCQ